MNMKVLMEISEWAGRCGYFFNANDEMDIVVNNGYNCRHSECGHIELGVGGCHAGACPFGYEADEEDCENFGLEYEEAAFIIVDIPEEDYVDSYMWTKKIIPQRDNKSKISIEIFVDSNEEFLKFKKDIDDCLDATLAIISNNRIHYELCAECGSLNIYKSEKNEDGEFETVDKYNASEFLSEVEELEGFAAKLIKLFL